MVKSFSVLPYDSIGPHIEFPMNVTADGYQIRSNIYSQYSCILFAGTTLLCLGKEIGSVKTIVKRGNVALPISQNHGK